MKPTVQICHSPFSIRLVEIGGIGVVSELVDEPRLGWGVFKTWEFKSLQPQMKKNINNQVKLSNLFCVNEEERKMFKLMTMNSILGSSTRDKLGSAFNKLVESDLMRVEGISSIRRVCLVSGRGRGLVKSFKVSRIKFKESFNRGLISGSRKSSW